MKLVYKIEKKHFFSNKMFRLYEILTTPRDDVYRTSFSYKIERKSGDPYYDLIVYIAKNDGFSDHENEIALSNKFEHFFPPYLPLNEENPYIEAIDFLKTYGIIELEGKEYTNERLTQILQNNNDNIFSILLKNTSITELPDFRRFENAKEIECLSLDNTHITELNLDTLPKLVDFEYYGDRISNTLKFKGYFQPYLKTMYLKNIDFDDIKERTRKCKNLVKLHAIGNISGVGEFKIDPGHRISF